MAVYKDEQRGTWYCKFYYKDWRGKRRQALKRGFAKKKDAQAYESDFKARSQAAPDMSLKALATEFLADYKLRRSVNSYKLTETNIRVHILPALGDMAIKDISPLTIRTWQNGLVKSGKAPSTLRAINTSFQTMLAFAVRFYNLPVNPFSRVDAIGKTEKRQDFIEPEDWQRVFERIDNLHDRALFSLLYWGGMRLGEVQGLSVKDINFDTNTVNIDKQYSSDQKKVVPLKTQTSKREISIPQIAMAIVKEYFDSLIEVPLYPFTLKTARGINYKLKKYCEAAHVRPISAHALRHSHASLLIKEGVAINLIAKRLGHPSPTVTLNVYSHVFDNQDKELADVLDTIESNTSKTESKKSSIKIVS